MISVWSCHDGLSPARGAATVGASRESRSYCLRVRSESTATTRSGCWAATASTSIPSALDMIAVRASGATSSAHG